MQNGEVTRRPNVAQAHGAWAASRRCGAKGRTGAAKTSTLGCKMERSVPSRGTQRKFRRARRAHTFVAQRAQRRLECFSL